jgi:DNA-binding protein YbaB
MLDKLKDLNKLRKAQSEIKKQLEAISVQNEKNGITVLIRGDKKIEKILIDGEEQKELREVLNDTMKEVDKKVEKQMRGQLGELGFGDFGL